MKGPVINLEIRDFESRDLHVLKQWAPWIKQWAPHYRGELWNKSCQSTGWYMYMDYDSEDLIKDRSIDQSQQSLSWAFTSQADLLELLPIDWFSNIRAIHHQYFKHPEGCTNGQTSHHWEILCVMDMWCAIHTHSFISLHISICMIFLNFARHLVCELIWKLQCCK